MTEINVNFDPRVSVAAFIKAFGASLDVMLWTKLIEEETKELLDALRKGDRENGLKEMVDVLYVMTGAGLVEPTDIMAIISDETEAVIDMVIEEANAAFDAAQEEWEFTAEVFTEAFARVHMSNMSKLDENGKPIKREDGKVLKGPLYKPADLSDLV